MPDKPGEPQAAGHTFSLDKQQLAEPWVGEEESGRSLGQTPSSFREFPVYKEGLGLWNPQTQDIKTPVYQEEAAGPGT